MATVILLLMLCQAITGIRFFENPIRNVTCLGWAVIAKSLNEQGSGFAMNANSGNLCTGFIRDVINLHLLEMTADGFIDNAGANDFRRTQTIDCDTYRPELAALADQANETTGGTSSARHS